MQGIVFDDFSCFYKDKKEYIIALDKLSFQILPGELFVVVGPSGSGKSTLLRCILGMCEYVEGQLHIDGVSVDEFDVRHGNVGYVSQEYALYPTMTVYENIASPLRIMHTEQEETDRRVKKIAQMLEIDWLLTRLPRQLSGGQQQRVVIARALVKNPGVVLLDEPFSNVDPVLRNEMLHLIKKLHKTYGNTMVYVTHRIDEAVALADRILVLDEGCAAALGTPEQICALEEYSE